MQNPVQSFLQNFSSKHAFYPETIFLINQLYFFKLTTRFCIEQDFCGSDIFSFIFMYFLTLITFVMEERDKVGYEQTGPLRLPNSWAACKHCAGQRMSIPGTKKQMLSFLDSSQKPKKTSNFLVHFLIPPSPTF